MKALAILALFLVGCAACSLPFGALYLLGMPVRLVCGLLLIFYTALLTVGIVCGVIWVLGRLCESA